MNQPSPIEQAVIDAARIVVDNLPVGRSHLCNFHTLREAIAALDQQAKEPKRECRCPVLGPFNNEKCPIHGKPTPTPTEQPLTVAGTEQPWRDLEHGEYFPITFQTPQQAAGASTIPDNAAIQP